MYICIGVYKMKRLNITIDNDLYEKARAMAFVKRVSISQMIRNSLSDFLNKHSNRNIDLLLTEKDEEKLLNIIQNEEFISSDKAKSELGL